MNDVKRYICMLPSDINKCCYIKDNLCLNPKVGCGFREEEEKSPKNPYIRQKRWYEEITKPK